MLSFPGTVRVYRHPPDTEFCRLKENMISSWRLQAPDFKPFGLIFIFLGPFEFIDVPLIMSLKDSMRTISFGPDAMQSTLPRRGADLQNPRSFRATDPLDPAPIRSKLGSNHDEARQTFPMESKCSLLG